MKTEPYEAYFGQRVRVYRNLTRKCYSVLDLKTKRVAFYATRLVLDDVTFKVSVAGRNRVVRTGKKFVHAFAEGKLCTPAETVAMHAWLEKNGTPLRYNPYAAAHFHNPRSPGHPIKRVNWLLMDAEGLRARLWDYSQETCPHDEDDQESLITLFDKGVYHWRKCYGCGKEFHNPDELRTFGLALK